MRSALIVNKKQKKKTIIDLNDDYGETVKQCSVHILFRPWSMS